MTELRNRQGRAGWRTGAIFLVGALLLAACGSGEDPPASDPSEAEATDAATQEPEETYTLTMASFTQPTHTYHVSGEWFVEEVEKRSDGRIEIEFHPAGSLVGQGEMLEAGATGVADIVAIVNSLFQAEMPFSADAATLPALWDLSNFEQVIDILEPVATEELEAQGLRYLWTLGTVQQWFLTEPVDLDNPDFSGRRIRTFGGNQNRAVELVGGNPVTISLSEVPSAVASGLLDGLLTSLGSFHGLGMYQEVPCLLLTNEVPTTSMWAINSETYDELPEDLQQIIDEVAEEAEQFSEDYLKEDEDRIQAAAAEETDCILEFTDEQRTAWQEQFTPLYDEFRERHGAQADEFLEAVEEI